jgi:hypothetical protein
MNNNSINAGGEEPLISPMSPSFKIKEFASSEQVEAGESAVPPSVISSDSCCTDDGESSSNSEDDDHEPTEQQHHRKSVRFSFVKTREYNVINELEEVPDAPPRRSLGWEYTERQIDLETHLSDSIKERNEKYNRLIIEHMARAERQQQERERIEELKKKGWKNRAKRQLKSFGKGLLVAVHRSSFAIVTNPYG